MATSTVWTTTVLKSRIDWNEIKDRVDLARVVTALLGPAPSRQGRRLLWPCPFHNDSHPSFEVDPQRGMWRCWPCNLGGDAPALVMKRNGVAFPEAVRVVAELSGIVTASGRSVSPPPRPVTASKTEKAASPPPEYPSGLSLADALALVTEAAERLWKTEGSTARDYLHGRCLTDETIRAACLGVVASVSIPTQEGDRCYQARGVIVPWHEGNRLAMVKIRQPEGVRPKYVEAFRDRPRIFPDPEAIEPGRPLVIAEGEFDALLLGQELRDLAAVVTLGSASNRPDPTILGEMLAAAPWFIATDNDPAGDKAAGEWPARAVRIRPPKGKDWTEAAQAGVNLRRWWSDRLAGTDAPALFPGDGLARYVFAVDSSGTAELVEGASPHGLGTTTLPEASPPPCEGQTAAPETGPAPSPVVSSFWTAANSSDEDVAALDAILAWPIDDRTSWAELIEAGRAHNAAVLARRGKT
jgi:hypothetical protein